MGIVKLIQYFDIKKVIRFKKCHAKIYVDSLFFWELWQMLRSLEYFEDQEIERDYLVHIFTNILALELRAESIETLEAIYIVFDNNSSRNYMKYVYLYVYLSLSLISGPNQRERDLQVASMYGS